MTDKKKMKQVSERRQDAEYTDEHIRARAAEVPLYGLVLAGGESTRMNHDKALLDYHGRPQAQVIYDLLKGVCENVYISSRAGQWSEGGLNDLPEIHDIFHALGPMSGILSAMHTHPNAAWLVVACDLPFIKSGTIAKLVGSRDPLKMATCFKSTRDQLPEPLCAIYEPKIRARLFEYVTMGNLSPRDVLRKSQIKMMDQTDEDNLENVNYSDEYLKAKTELVGGEE